jgi:uncharacterized membrane protein YhhN
MTFFSSRNLIAIVAAGCSVLLVLLLIRQDIAAAVSKLVASSAFVVLAFQVGGLGSGYGRLILLGLVFSWFGDAFLIGQTQTFFLLGLGAFLLAHVAYITAFIVKGISARWTAAAALPIAATAIIVSVWLAPHVPPDLVVPVRVYTVAISLMVIAAFGTRGRGASTLILAGAFMFFLSDLSVAALRLVQTDFPTYVWGLPLYYAGQVCLAVSTSQSRSH